MSALHHYLRVGVEAAAVGVPVGEDVCDAVFVDEVPEGGFYFVYGGTGVHVFGRGFLSERHEHDLEAFVDGGLEAVFAGLDCAFHGTGGWVV